MSVVVLQANGLADRLGSTLCLRGAREERMLSALLGHGRDQGLADGSAADGEDLRRCLGGDGDAYCRIIARNQAMVARLLWRFSRDPETHEELVQETFVQAYESLAQYRGTGPLPRWLARIATRVGYHHWQQEKRERAARATSAVDIEALPEAPTDDPADHARAAELLHRLLATLSPRDRLVLTLRYVEGYSVERTAELAGWSPTMVKVQALRARGKLRAAFAKAEREAVR